MANRHHLSRILGNSGWLFAEKTVRMLVHFAVSAWVVRYLGPTQQGLLVFVTAFVAVFQVVAELGLTNVAVRELARRPEYGGRILGSIFRIRLFSSAICWLTAIVLVWLWKEDTQILILTIFIASAVLFQSVDTIDLWFQSQSQSRRTVVSRTAALVASNLLRVALIVSGAPLLAFAIVVPIEFSLVAIGLWISYRRFPNSGNWTFDTSEARNILRRAWPFFLSGCLLVVANNADKIIIAELLDLDQLGFYGAAYLLISSAIALPVAISSSTAPFIARADSSNERSQQFIYLYSALWWSALGIFPFFFFFSTEIISILFGPRFLDASSTLRLLSFAIIPVFLSLGNDYLSLMSGRGRVTLYRTLLGLFLSIGLLFQLIPLWGINGAAIAILLSHLLSNTLICWLLMPDSFGLQLRGLLLPAILIQESRHHATDSK